LDANYDEPSRRFEIEFVLKRRERCSEWRSHIHLNPVHTGIVHDPAE